MNAKQNAEACLPTYLTTDIDALYRAGAPAEILETALNNLRHTIATAQLQILHYTQLEHSLTGQIFCLLRGEKLLAVDFGLPETDFLARVGQQFGSRPYRDGPHSDALSASIAGQLRDYLDGRRQDFEIETDLGILTDFQRQVLAATSQVPRGSVVTYMDIARRIGNPKAVRAVGQALGRNPVPIIIPCHRVIAANGALGGYSGGGGLVTKVRLLQLEGALLGP